MLTKQSKKGNKLKILFFILILGILIQLFRPTGKPHVVLGLSQNQTYYGGELNINWLNNTQDAIAIDNLGLITQTLNQTPMPTASVAKIMTAYIILRDHPLNFGENGPSIEITKHDVELYKHDKENGQSVVKVSVGEILNERQALEALLLPSANNIASVLAKWDAGSIETFVAKMNQQAKNFGMQDTHYSDPAGIKLSTQSTAHDQLLLAQKAMQIPTFRHLVAMPQAVLPVCGTVYNVNYALGRDGIVGIKTGSMPQIGANYVFASEHFVGYKKVLIIGAIFGSNGKEPLMDALKGAIKAVNSVKSALQLKCILKEGQVIGELSYPNGFKTKLIATESIYSIMWPGKHLEYKFALRKKINLPIAKGEIMGRLFIENKTVPIAAETSINKPTLWVKLTRL